MNGPPDTLKVALVGFGLAGEVFHAPLIEANPALALVSIVTADPERSARARARHPSARVMPDVGSVWSTADEHDVVVIATPNRFHEPVGLAALEAGLHVVVDKPFAPSAAQGRRLADAASTAGLVLTVFQNRRFDGDFLTARRLIEDGDLGTVVRFESRFERWRPGVDPGAWRELADPEDAGGLLFDLGSHLIDQAVVLFGRPTRIYAEAEPRRPGAVIDDDAFVALTHPGGVHSHLWMSAVAGSLGPRVRVLGLGAAYEKHGLDPQEAQLAAGMTPGDPAYGVEPEDRWGWVRSGEQQRRVPSKRGDYPRFYHAVVQAVRGTGAPPVTPEEAVDLLTLLEAARTSAASGQVVSVEG